jgi:endonuclease/exonuclease/phosphatase family metal-dependent hydrolase
VARRLLEPRPMLGRTGLLLAVLAACACGDDSAEATPEVIESDVVARPGDFVITGWNLEFFGSTTTGPRDDGLQVANAATVIGRIRPHVLGLQEMVDAARFEELRQALPSYQAIIADDPSVAGAPGGYTATTTRPALFVTRDRVEVRSAKLVAEIDFGRPPLEVALSVERGGRRFDPVVMVVHFYPFAERPSWYRRRDTGDRLKRYLDANHPHDAVAVIGDFNDDVDESILEGWPSPYAQLRDDAARYRFTTQGLSVARQGTTVDWPSTIDHHLVTNELAELFVSHSAWVDRPSYIADYRGTTSDHYPVTTRYRFGL